MKTCGEGDIDPHILNPCTRCSVWVSKIKFNQRLSSTFGDEICGRTDTTLLLFTLCKEHIQHKTDKVVHAINLSITSLKRLEKWRYSSTHC
jgi:hypothetical protein